MADFCKQCSEEIFNEDFKELADLCGTAEVCITICEGCGGCRVNKDGVCQGDELNKHGRLEP